MPAASAIRSPLPLLLAALLGSAVLGAACRNPCQQLCVEISDYATDQCGVSFTDAELDQCISDHGAGSLEKGEAGVCRDGLGNVADEWDCEEIASYFDADTGGGAGGGSDTGS